ncbi:MAG: hypothetical protein U0073_00100, partial [Bacteroidia bacterium]
MKTTILCVVVALLTISKSLFSSTLVPFPFYDSKWTYNVYDFNCGVTGYCGLVSYKFENDTNINGRTYYQLFSTNLNDTVYNYIASVREDSVSGNLYAFFQNGQCSNRDTLLYSFLWNIGDTIKECDNILG